MPAPCLELGSTQVHVRLPRSCGVRLGCFDHILPQQHLPSLSFIPFILRALGRSPSLRLLLGSLALSMPPGKFLQFAPDTEGLEEDSILE